MLIMYTAMLDTEDDKLLFHKVYKKYEKSVFSAALSMSKTVENAEDLQQKTFIKVAFWIKKKHTVPADGLYAWLITILRHIYIDDKRKKNSQIIAVDLEEADKILYFDLNSSITENYSFEEIIAGLPEIDKDILRMKYILEYNSVEIANVIGTTPEVVRKRTERIINKLREYYRKEEHNA